MLVGCVPPAVVEAILKYTGKSQNDIHTFNTYLTHPQTPTNLKLLMKIIIFYLSRSVCKLQDGTHIFTIVQRLHIAVKITDNVFMPFYCSSTITCPKFSFLLLESGPSQCATKGCTHWCFNFQSCFQEYLWSRNID